MELHNKRRANKCEPRLKFNPLNMAKIAGFARWVYRAKSVPSDFLFKSVDDSNPSYFKHEGSNKIASKLEALGCALLSGAIG